MNKETVLCPVKGVNIYLWVCREKCSYKKKKKCPLEVRNKDWSVVAEKHGDRGIITE